MTQGYNFNNDKGRRIAVWLRLIERDRNYARMLFGLPLRQPIRREIRLAAKGLGYTARQTMLEDGSTESPRPLDPAPLAPLPDPLEP